RGRRRAAEADQAGFRTARGRRRRRVERRDQTMADLDRATPGGRPKMTRPEDPSAEPVPAAVPELSPWRRFWRRYSPYGEFPRSSVSSLSLHLLLVLLLILMSGALKPKEHVPPGVDVVQVGDEPDAAPGMGDGLPAAGQPLSETPAAIGAEGPADDATPDTMPVEAVNTNIKPTEAAADIDAPTAQDLAAQAATAASSASRAA